jgi:hypothetical protein
VWGLDATILTDASGQQLWSAAALGEWVDSVRRRRTPNDTTGRQPAILLREAARASAAPRAPDYRDFNFHPVPEDLVGSEFSYGESIIPARVGGRDSFILPDGRTASRAVYQWGFKPGAPPGSWEPAEPPRPAFEPAIPGSLPAVRALVAESAITTALGAALLVAGVCTLAKLGGSARLHRVWALAKFVQVPASFVLAAWYLSTLGPAVSAQMNLAPVLLGVLLSAAYPVIVLVVLATPPALA